MQPEFQTISGYGGGVDAAARNKVLRNTYALLALSLVPTVLGAWIGVSTGLAQALLKSPWISFGVFMVGAFGFIYLIEKNKNSSVGVAMLMAFTFFMGIMLSRLVGFTLGMKNGAALIGYAFSGTALIFAAMASLGTVIKRDLSGMGKFLFIGSIVVLFGAVLSMVFQVPALQLAMIVMVLLISSAYMVYDVNRVVTGGETNYISATTAIYIDIYNVFSSLLALLGIGNSGD